MIKTLKNRENREMKDPFSESLKKCVKWGVAPYVALLIGLLILVQSQKVTISDFFPFSTEDMERVESFNAQINEILYFDVF